MTVVSRTDQQVRNYLGSAGNDGYLFRQYTRFADTLNMVVPASGAHVQAYVKNILSDALAAGYNLYRQSDVGHKSNPLFLHKDIRNDNGDILFWIHIEVWDYCLEFPDNRHRQPHNHVRLSPKVQFRSAMERTVDVTAFVNPEDTLETIEAFFMHFYRNMWCEPNERAP